MRRAQAPLLASLAGLMALATRLRWILNIELVGFAAIPFLATLMARGVGLPG